MSKKVIIAAANYWTSPYQVGSHHFARMFAKNGWEVLFVSDPLSPFHFAMRNKKQVLERYDIHKGIIQSGYDNISIYVPMAAITPNEKPIFRSQVVTKNWYKVTKPNVVEYAKKLGFGKVDLLWFDSIVQYFWIDEIKYKKSILRVSDRMDAFKKSSPNIKNLKEEFKDNVDLIVYTAKTLKSYLKDYENKIVYLSNGVDIEHFLKSSKEIPEDLRDIPKPIAIYVGAVDEWFGINFLVDVARKCRGISFIIIGSPNVDVSKLQNESNIFILGRREYKKIPAYMYNSNVGIITFNIGHPVVKSVNPIKLYEYMACGLPVVATRWEELEIINSPAYLADSPDDFANGLNSALGSSSREKYVKFAKANSWEERFKKIVQLCDN